MSEDMNETFENEADFISMAHDRQMAAQSPAKAIYYKMHKEMTPPLVHIIQAAMREMDAQVQVAEVLEAYARFIASQMGAVVTLVADPYNPSAKVELAQILLDGIGKSLANGLAKKEENPINRE